MSTHTPGPWQIRDGGAGPDGSIEILDCSHAPWFVATVHDGIVGRDDESQTDANAALIAAAPDLLEALKALHGAVGESGWLNCTPKPTERMRRVDQMNLARAAIAKATGQEDA